MALVPYTLRPSFLVRRNAMRRGILGPSTMWKVVAVVVFGRSTLRRHLGKQPERLGTVKLRRGQHLRVSTFAPTTGLSRRQRRRVLARLRADAVADVAAARGS
jgi:hypothetical protein